MRLDAARLRGFALEIARYTAAELATIATACFVAALPVAAITVLVALAQPAPPLRPSPDDYVLVNACDDCDWDFGRTPAERDELAVYWDGGPLDAEALRMPAVPSYLAPAKSVFVDHSDDRAFDIRAPPPPRAELRRPGLACGG